MKSLSLLLVLLAGIGLGSCDSTTIPLLPDNGNLPFGLIIPGNRPAADYHAVSGVSTRLVATKVGDSIVESPQTLFYAQFTASPGVPRLKSVLLNTVELGHHLKGDTLRLGRSPGSSIYGDNLWTLLDSGETKANFTMPKINVVDTVLPFDTRTTIRGDVALTLSWRRPTLVSSALYISWKTPNHTFEKTVSDYAGSYEIPQEEMKKLQGRGEVVITRYYYMPQKFKERTVMLTRIAQRTFSINVL